MTCQPSGVAAAKTRSTNGRGTDRAVCPDRRGRQLHDLLPDIVDAARLDRLAQPRVVRRRQRLRQDAAGSVSKPGMRSAERAGDRHLPKIVQHLLARARARRTTRSRYWASQDLRPEDAAQIRRHEAQQRARLDEAGARHVGDDRVAVDGSPTTGAERRGGMRRSARSDRRSPHPRAARHVRALQPGDGAHVHQAVMHDKVVAFDQQKAEIFARDTTARNRSRCRDPASSGRCAAASAPRIAVRPLRKARKNGASRSTFICA